MFALQDFAACQAWVLGHFFSFILSRTRKKGRLGMDTGWEDSGNRRAHYRGPEHESLFHDRRREDRSSLPPHMNCLLAPLPCSLWWREGFAPRNVSSPFSFISEPLLPFLLPVGTGGRAVWGLWGEVVRRCRDGSSQPASSAAPVKGRMHACACSWDG